VIVARDSAFRGALSVLRSPVGSPRLIVRAKVPSRPKYLTPIACYYHLNIVLA